MSDAASPRPAGLDSLLVSVLCGEDPDSLTAYAVDEVCGRAAYHGVMPLLAESILTTERAGGAVLRERLRQQQTEHVAADLIREGELRRLLFALGDAGVRALVFKGTHVAYGWYPRPDLRPRLDTDLLIPASARQTTHQVLAGLGYDMAGHASGALLTYQAPYTKASDGTVIHVVDVHWRIANPQVFAGVLTYNELSDEGEPLLRLAPSAWAPCAAHALLLACVHRVAHHFDSNRLVWLYDVHLIASHLPAAGWERFLDLARARGVATVCRRSLEQAVDCFCTNIPPAALEDERLIATASEATAAYLGRPRRHVQNVVDDLQALPSWRERTQLLREHLFPAPQYMRNVYARSSRAPLFVLYLTRAVRGARRWLERPTDDPISTR